MSESAVADQAAQFGDKSAANKAIELIIPELRRDPDDVDANFALGLAMQQIGRNDQAARALQKVLARQPRHEPALETIAQVFQASRDLLLAKTYYRQLLDVNPRTARYYEQFAIVLAQLGESSASVSSFETALELDPSRKPLHARLAAAYERLGDTARAEYHANKFKALAGTDTRK